MPPFVGLLLATSTLAPAALAAPVQRTSTPVGEVAWFEEGQGEPAILLVHGLPTSTVLWEEVIPALALDHRVIAVDLPNFGESEKRRGRLDHPQRADAIEAVRQAAGIDSFVLVAHDLGASVALDYLDRHGSHVQRLVLASSPVYPDFDEPPSVDLLRTPVLGPFLLALMPRTLFKVAMKQGLVHDEQLSPDRVQRFVAPYLGAGGPRALYDNLWWGRPEEAFVRYPEIMRQISIPTLLLQGEQDPFIPMEHALRQYEDIVGARLVVIADGAHFLPLDTPGDVAGAILDFLHDTAPDPAGVEGG